MIFIAIRVPLFLVFQLCSCFCNKGADYLDDDTFEDRIISYDYISYEKGTVNNNNGASNQVGENEIEFNRRLNILSESQILRMNEQLANLYGPDRLPELADSMR